MLLLLLFVSDEVLGFFSCFEGGTELLERANAVLVSTNNKKIINSKKGRNKVKQKCWVISSNVKNKQAGACIYKYNHIRAERETRFE